MMIPVSDIGRLGLIGDVPFTELPPEAWTDARNVRFRNGAVETFLGHSTLGGSASVAPHFVLAVPDPSATDDYLIYTSLAKAYVYDGSAHTDITRLSGDYSATAGNSWTGGILGGVAILNNERDIPQYWAYPPSAATRLADLPGWSASWRAAVVRPFGRFLVALDVTKASGRDPYSVKWSHSADPGSPPASWDETDPTLDAGEFSLIEKGGFLVDALSLRDQLMIYRRDSTWSMRFIGGNDIFAFGQVFPDYGCLARNAIASVGDQHLVATQSNIIVHNGFEAQPLLDNRLRDFYLNLLDPANNHRVFIVPNYPFREMWVCFPANSATPDLALVWNYTDNTWTVRDLPTISMATVATVTTTGAGGIWDGDGGMWDTDSTIWDEGRSHPRQRLVMADADGNRLLLADDGYQFTGTNFTARATKQGLAAFGLKRSGEPKVSAEHIKHVRALWPQAQWRGESATLDVWVGAQMRPSDAIDWSGPFTYNPATQSKIDCRVTGRILSFRFETRQNAQIVLGAFTLDMDIVGRY